MTSEYQPPQSDIAVEQEMANPPLFSPDGRIGRIRYLAHNFWMTAVVYVVGFALVVGATTFSESLAGIVSMIMMLAVFAVMFLLTIKRSHDINISGWWSLLALIPLVNLFFVFKSGTPERNNYGPVPKPNTPLLWLGGLAFPIFFIVGILAAIAIPAYQDYTSRAQIGEGLTAAVQLKTTMAEFAQPRGRWPTQNELTELGLDQPVKSQFATLHAHPDTGAIEIVMDGSSGVGPSIANGTLLLVPAIEEGVLRFKCSSEDIDPRFLPSSCRQQ